MIFVPMAIHNVRYTVQTDKYGCIGNETILPEIDINLELWNYDVDANNVKVFTNTCEELMRIYGYSNIINDRELWS